GVDPHFWHDPLRVAVAMQLVADRLHEIDGSGGWHEAAAEYGNALEALDAEIVDVLSVIPDDSRLLVTDHDSFRYFADRYGFRVLGTLVPGTSTMAEPSASHLQELAELVEREG